MTSKDYKTFPYTFGGRPNETVRSVIRLYNDMDVKPDKVDDLLKEFNAINSDKLPPKLGTTVLIPVLIPFCYRHENENQVFTDGK